MKIPDDAREALGRAECDGPLLRLGRQLDPVLYGTVNTVLEAIGAHWDPRLQAHEFPPESKAAALLDRALDAGEVTTEAERRKASQWYPTPDEQAVRLMVLSQTAPGDVVLEPSAGDGAIARVLAANGAVVDCIERDPGRAAAIRAAGCARTVTTSDFLDVPARREYQQVVMNPPFAGDAAGQHVLHALGFLRPGGTLAALLPASIRWRQTSAAAQVRRLAADRGGLWENVPDGAFAASGAHAKTVMLVIPGPGGPARPGTAPVRVTVDDRTPGRHFDPLATPPGVYVYRDPWRGYDRVFRSREPCAACGSRTWGHDDGDNDTRGIFEHRDYEPVGAGELSVPAGPGIRIEVSRCGGCWETRQSNDKAVAAAEKLLAARLAGVPAPVPAKEAARRPAARRAGRGPAAGTPLTLF